LLWEDNKKSFHPECSENCPFQGNWLESDKNLVQVKHNLLNPMAEIFVPAYLNEIEYCDKGDTEHSGWKDFLLSSLQQVAQMCCTNLSTPLILP
jgi:hypothetical protein